MIESILSVGIDVGTSTTQLIFSKLMINNISGYGQIPKVEIIDKKIIYRSPIYFTPLIDRERMDGSAIKKMIEHEYEAAGILPKDLTTGAVIITGESSRKKNASDVAKSLSELAGDFVVATAGPDLESVLAGKGACADQYSLQTGKVVANLDIGGGTTNISMFQDGKLLDTACMDLGGRLIQIDALGCVTYISTKMQRLIEENRIAIELGKILKKQEADKLCAISADLIAEVLFGSIQKRVDESLSTTGKEQSEDWSKLKTEHERKKWADYFITNHGLRSGVNPDIITYSGGVADCIWEDKVDYMYGDLGVLLGRAIRQQVQLANHMGEHQKETMRATVIGAGNYSMDVSGSTIEYVNCIFPIKNVPVARIECESTDQIVSLPDQIQEAKIRLEESKISGDTPVALSMKGPQCPRFVEIEQIAELMYQELKKVISNDRMFLLIIESDIAKAMGQALKRRFAKTVPLLCIDGVSCQEGDYIDIGKPLAGGKVVPVVVKTLIFQTAEDERIQ